MDLNLTTGPGLLKAISILGGVVAAATTAATFVVNLATTADVDKAQSASAPASIVLSVEKNTKSVDAHAAAIAKLDKEFAVRDAVVNGKLDIILAAQAEQVKRSPARRRKMAMTIVKFKREAAAAGMREDPLAGIDAIQEVAGDAGSP